MITIGFLQAVGRTRETTSAAKERVPASQAMVHGTSGNLKPVDITDVVDHWVASCYAGQEIFQFVTKQASAAQM